MPVARQVDGNRFALTLRLQSHNCYPGSAKMADNRIENCCYAGWWLPWDDESVVRLVERLSLQAECANGCAKESISG